MEDHIHLPPPSPQPVRCNQCGLRLPSLGSIRRHYTAAHPHLARRKGFVELQAAAAAEATTASRDPEPAAAGGEEAVSGEATRSNRRSRSSKKKAANLLSKVTRGQLIVVGGEAEKEGETVTIDMKKRRGRGRAAGQTPDAVPSAAAAAGTESSGQNQGKLALLAETLANTPSLKCVYCGKQFTKRSLLRRHLVVHTKERPHLCRTCGRGFTQAASLKIHEQLHLKARPYVCEECGEQFAQKGNRKNHYLRMHGAAKEGKVIKEEVTPTATEARAVQTAVSPMKAYQCPHCNLLSEKESDIRVHMVEEHHMLPESPQPPPPPPPTEASTSFVKQLEDTLMEADYMAAAGSAGQGQLVHITEALDVALTADQPRRHSVDLDADPGRGAVVLVAQPDPSCLQAPYFINQPRTEPPPDAAPAVAPEGGVHELVDRATGRRIVHLVKKSSDGKRRLFVCQLCLREFKKSVDLVRHNRQHTSDRPFQCAQCRKRFRLKSVLQAHLRTHQGTKAFQCHFCNKRFTMSQSLRVHMRLHTGHQPYACHLCPMRFATSSHRKYHVRTHPDRDFRQLTRSVLSSSAGPVGAERKALTPLRVDTRLGRLLDDSEEAAARRPHHCPYCPAAYKMENHLRAHVRQRHLGESREAVCQHCGKSFVNQHTMRQHVAARHLHLRPHQCQLCRATFTTKSSLSRHMHSHTSERPFMCRVCRRTFKTADTCRRHMRCHAQDHVGAMAPEHPPPPPPPPPPPAQTLAFEQSGDANLDQVLHSLINAPPETVDTTGVQRAAAHPGHGRPPGDVPVNVTSAELVPAGQTFVLQSSAPTPAVSTASGGRPLPAIVEEAQCIFPVNAGPTYAYVTSDDQTVSFGPESLLNVLEAHIICDSAQAPGCDPQVYAPTTAGHVTGQPQQSVPPTQQQQQTAQGDTIIRVDHDGNSYLANGALAYNQCVILTAPADPAPPQPGQQQQQTAVEEPGSTFALLSDELAPGEMVMDGTLLRSTNPDHGVQEKAETAEQSVLADPEYYGCSECSVSFNSSAQLTAHVRQEHSVPKQHRCNYCLKFFSSWLVLTVHLRAHTVAGEETAPADVETMMELCGDEYQQQPQQTGRRSSASALSHDNRCPACQADFPTQASLSRHVTSAHERTVLPYVCRHCGTVFRTIRELRAHVMELLEERQTVKVSMKAAKKKYSQRMTYAKAMQHRLRLDDAQTNQIAELQPNSHMTVSEKYLIEVAKEKHVLSLPGDNPRNSAEKTTNRGGVGLGHRARDGFLTQRLTTRNAMRPYVCQICCRSFRRPSDLQRHSLTHTGEKPFTCLKCARPFSSKDALKTHQRRHAAECKLYICHVCGVTCSTKASLKVHMRLHTGSMPYGCTECGMRFRTPSQRISHFAVVHKQSYPAARKKTSFVLSSDGTSAVIEKKETQEIEGGQGTVLEFHPVSVETQVAPSDIDSLRVESIGQVAEVLAVKKSSQSTQTNERPVLTCVSTDQEVPKSPLMGAFITRGWRCTQCGRDFLDNCMYQTHSCISNQTGTGQGIADKDKTGDFTGEGKLGSSSRQENVCDICSKAFTRPSNLQRHRRIHTGEKPFVCPICDRAFNQECALRVHLLKHSAQRPHRCPVCNAGFSQRGNMISHLNRLHAGEKGADELAPVSTVEDECLAE